MKNSEKEKRSAASYVAFFVSFSFLFLLLEYFKYFSSFAVVPSLFLFVGAGVGF